MGINWSFSEDKYNLGILQFNLDAPNEPECQWKLENETIERLKNSYEGHLAQCFYLGVFKSHVTVSGLFIIKMNFNYRMKIFTS
jgi:hypothetical protein